MKKMLMVSACAFALSAGGAFAQSQPAPGESSQGNVGPGTGRDMTDTRRDMTTGSSTMRRPEMMDPNSPSANPSSQGNVGPGTNQNNTLQPERR